MNSKDIKKLLNESAFNPKQAGPLSAVFESKNPDYLIQRAIEFLREAQSFGDKDKNLKVAVSLIVMARALLPKPESKTCGAVFTGTDNAQHVCDRSKGHVSNAHGKAYGENFIAEKK